MHVCACVSHDEGPGITLGREGRASANQSLEGTITLESVFICQGREVGCLEKQKRVRYALLCGFGLLRVALVL